MRIGLRNLENGEDRQGRLAYLIVISECTTFAIVRFASE